MLWLLPPLFLIGLLLFEPIYLQFTWVEWNLWVHWLPGVFGGTARPVLIRWGNAVRRKSTHRTWKDRLALLRICTETLELAQLDIRGGFGHCPAVAAILFGTVGAVCSAGRASFFFHRTQTCFIPFASGGMAGRVVFRVVLGHLFLRYMKWRFGK